MDGSRENAFAALLVCWLLLTLVVFSVQRPWWQYYYVHNAVPLALCAAVGIVGLWKKSEGRNPKVERTPKQEIRRNTRKDQPSRGKLLPSWTSRVSGLRVALVIYLICAGAWMAGRLYLQVSGIRNSPQIYSSLLLKEIERFKPFTKFMFTDQPVYSFHARIPLPPSLAIMSLKRFWTGDMTNERLVSELKEIKPELILLANSTRELPYQDFLDREYRLVYQDNRDSLYAHRSIANKARY